ncbi:MAG: zinc-dependent peptidase [Bacteroidota bacterium]
MQNAPIKARLNQILAGFLTMIIGSGFFFAGLQAYVDGRSVWGFAIAGFVVCFFIYRAFTGKFRNRSKVLDTPFPAPWRKLLLEHVFFYRSLNEDDKRRFENEVQIFLAEKRITGIKTSVSDKDRILVAASAVIPIFGFREWEYDNLGEVLLYPGNFNRQFEQEGKGRSVLGMVGHGAMSGVMILSKPALNKGFEASNDGHNVGIHEFVHLIDAQDGFFDGIPSLLDKQYTIPWINLMHEESVKIREGKSDINKYGLTNKAEFFAVVSEYFFEHPQDMAKEHPELYKMLTIIFQQDPKHRFSQAFKSLFGYTGKKVGRNSPCPCGSGEKYKRCCLSM